MYPTEDGGIVLEKWREFNALKAGLDHRENPDMSTRLITAFDDAIDSRTTPTIEILPEDLPIAREACEETLATKGLVGVYTRFMGVKRSAKRILSLAGRN